MSLKGGMSATELLNTIDAARKGQKKAMEKLSDCYQKGYLSSEEYNRWMTEYRTNKSRKIMALLCIILSIVLLVLLSVSAAIYHNNAIEEAYNKGRISGYTTGHAKEYTKGYENGYSHYEAIKDEYNFFHKYAVIVTETGEKYHRHNCMHLIGNNSFFIYNIENAEAKGYTPCLDCCDSSTK